MKSVIVFSSLAVAAAVAAAGSVALHAQTPAQSKYAESIYADFAQSSGNRVSFDVRTITSGPMKQLEGSSFAQIIGEPRYSLSFEDFRSTKIMNPGFDLSVPQIDRSELNGGVEGFDVVGRPVSKGQYRSLAIQATINGQTHTHQAIEFCWASLDHCVVYDPQIEFLDSVVNNYRIAKAEGYGPRIQETLVAPGDRIRPLAVCSLASNHAITGRSTTWASRKLTYKNLYGITVVTKNLGGQQIGISCTTSCAPGMYGYSNASSATTQIGFSADCGYKHAAGTTGARGTANSATKCTHKALGSAKADVSVNGSGASIGLSWDLSGSVDSSGGALTDTCGYF